MKYYIVILVCVVGLVIAPYSAVAEEAQPVEISAEKDLQWDRKNHRYLAHGDVEVVQGDVTLYADEMRAYYNADAGTSNLTNIEMIGNVRVVSKPYTAHGDDGVYDVAGGRAKLTGDNLRIVSPDQTITARDSLEYNSTTQEFFAYGRAHAVRGTYTLDADVLTALFDNAPSQEGEEKQSLKVLRARGNVVVSAPEEKIYGDRAVYDVKTELATMTGNVRIVQGPNVLRGSKAQMDMKIGVSQLMADPKKSSGDGRVRGVFYPASKKK